MITDLLIKLFVKDSAETSLPKVRTAYGVFAGAVGIATNLTLAAVKIVIGILSSSVSVIADGINNLSDTISGVIMLLGFKFAAKPADRGHPFGHMRLEYLTGVISSALIVLLGVTFLKSSVEVIREGGSTQASPVALVLLALAVAVKLWQLFFYRKVGKIISSSALKASAIDSRNDVIITSVVALGVLTEYLFDIRTDGYIGLGVAAFVCVSGVKMVAENANPLLGTTADRTLVDRLHELVKSFDGVMEAHDLLIHNYGVGVYYATIHIEVPEESNIVQAHDLAERIEREALEKLQVNLVIHVDPFITGNPEIEKMKSDVGSVLESINARLTFHDFHRVPCDGDSQLKRVAFDAIYPPELHSSVDELKVQVSEKLAQLYPDTEMIINFECDYNDYSGSDENG